MFRVLIVDDEILIRKRIRLGFDWEKLGYEVTEDVGSAEEALLLMQEQSYDLAIVDIAMPGMNGIELARKMRERNLSIRIIFLTGHSDFTYAKEAIRYGVYYYILKPVNEEEFVAVLEKLRIQLEKEKREKKLRDTLMVHQSRANLVLESQFFSEIFHFGYREQDSEQVIRALRGLGIDPAKEYRLAVMRIECFTRGSISLEERYRKLYDSIRECNENDTEYILICDTFDNHCILYRMRKDGDTENSVERELSVLQEATEKKLNTDVFCGISSDGGGIENLIKKYQEAICALNNTKIFQERVILFEKLKKRDESCYRIPSARIRELQDRINAYNYSECERMIKSIFQEFEEKQCDYDSIFLNANRLLWGISEAGSVSGPEMRLFMGEYKNMEAAFANMNSLAEICRWFCKMTKNLIESKAFCQSEGRNLPVVTKAKSMIQNESSNPELTQAGIAVRLGVTPTYLSSVFKKSVGISVTQYLNRIRLEQARELLLEEDLDVKKVAELVGYSDEYYFSRCFKKYHGISPSQIKKINR